jgi:UDPglucose--hexose-1-phosphate uridylyltransferase
MLEGSHDLLKLPPAHLLPQWRQNPITGQWVVIAPERGTRPVEKVQELHFPPIYESCPFCAGQEQQTPPEVFAIRETGTQPNLPGWRVRVVPNRYPALRALELQAEQVAPAVRFGFGKHELIIESPHHESNLANLQPDHVSDIIISWRERLKALSLDERFKYGHVFKNHGSAAGASVVHTHSQLIAIPFVPPILQQELDSGLAHHTREGRCVFCDLIRSEVECGERVVLETPRYVAMVAYAGRQPYETWILPRQHQCRMHTIDDDEASELGTVLWILLGKLSRVIDPLAYNVMLHTAPFHQGPLAHFHWHFEILPRTAQVAGFEWGTGLYINTMRPEDAADRLRRTGD